MFPGLGILRHIEDMALTLATNLVDELGEAGGAGEVDVGVRLYTVTVAAGDDDLIPFPRERRASRFSFQSRSPFSSSAWMYWP